MNSVCMCFYSGNDGGAGQSSGSHLGVILGPAIGAAAGLIICVLVGYLCLRRRKKRWHYRRSSSSSSAVTPFMTPSLTQTSTRSTSEMDRRASTTPGRYERATLKDKNGTRFVRSEQMEERGDRVFEPTEHTQSEFTHTFMHLYIITDIYS